jgi:o-succinylbenzoate synthase
MSLEGSFFKRTFNFCFDARTSRGPMKEKTSWFIKVWNNHNADVVGIGECGPIPGLSVDQLPEIENVLSRIIDKLTLIDLLSHQNVFETARGLVPNGFPSITFALETALLDLLGGGKKIIFENDFLTGTPIPINGLVWMGSPDFMLNQVHEKFQQGYRCIKLKVGGLDFDSECRILETIRSRYSPVDVTLRLDANGAFAVDDAIHKLRVLSRFSIHSIEQPVRAGTAEMEWICRQSPIPIALDEELIAREDEKHELLQRIQPQYIILKPTLHGGLQHCREWIIEAEQMNIGWWITSALESNIGLNAICQFTGNYNVTLPQGLGTGTLYTDNIKSPLFVERGRIGYDAQADWDVLTD